MKIIAFILAVVTGICLFIIACRSGMPMFGSIISEEVHKEIDQFDKKLAIAALISFVLCVIFLVSSF